MKLRLDTPMDDLADRFKISLATASSIFNTWIRVMSFHLKSLIFFPSRDIVAETMPVDFRQKQCKARVISRAVPNILFVFYSVRIVGRIVYSYSAE